MYVEVLALFPGCRPTQLRALVSQLGPGPPPARRPKGTKDMTTGEKAAVQAAVATALTNAIAAWFAGKTVDSVTRGYLTTGAPTPKGTTASTSLASDVAAELATTIVVNE